MYNFIIFHSEEHAKEKKSHLVPAYQGCGSPGQLEFVSSPQLPTMSTHGLAQASPSWAAWCHSAHSTAEQSHPRSTWSELVLRPWSKTTTIRSMERRTSAWCYSLSYPCFKSFKWSPTSQTEVSLSGTLRIIFSSYLPAPFSFLMKDQRNLKFYQSPKILFQVFFFNVRYLIHFQRVCILYSTLKDTRRKCPHYSNFHWKQHIKDCRLTCFGQTLTV